ncbi:helix-turn-helix transcriptional regulator [Actinoplanes sp. TBRC 11911]|uniref:helix-turn-helix domain-containing protein n=1 Tax=Actinoplanes sp. TBRC 11911 TaxID=2729386 RepID=UPI00145CF56C|nr:helix-turn-helix transcriptional regulator [Actinoplanes sp. TBRC 11911]NMO57771.1 helix-turn-helix transcriptional regulator [Actinoplanes sp. TBRC 11911]
MAEKIEIVPLEVVSRPFPARPAALPDVRDFVRRQLLGTTVTDDDIRVLCERVADVLLEGAGAAGQIQVSLRIFPDSAEVDVLFVPSAGTPPRLPAAPSNPDQPASAPPASPAPSFAAWLRARLQREGLTMEAAARRLDVSTKTISRWAGGTTEPRMRDLYRIREVFGEPFK